MHPNQPKTLGRLSVVLLLLTLMLGFEAKATHFRGGTLTWQQKGGNTIQFNLSTSWRRGFFGSPIVGGTINPGTFYFGDGTTASISAQVNSFDATSDIINTTYTVTHTYTSTGTFVVNALNSSGRLSTITDGNHDMPYNLQAIVNVGTPFNNSPVSSLPAIVNVPINSSSISFTIPGSDPDGDNITYRLSRVGNPSTGTNTVATADQSRESGLLIQAPPGFGLSSTGTVTMNTVGRSIGQTYAVQVMMEDRNPVTNILKSKTPVDFLIRMVAFSQAPTFVSPTPASNTVFNVLPGNNVSFTVSASDADQGQFVTLNPVAVPVGSTMSPSLPTSGPVNGTVSSTFSWTPQPSQVGTYVISFVAADNLGVQTLRNITIKVNCALDATTSITPAACAGINNGAIALTPQNFSSASNLAYSWDGPGSFSASTQNIASLPAGAYNVRIDDIATGCFKMVTANVANALTITPAISSNGPVCEGSTLNLSATGADSYSWTGPNSFSDATASPSISAVSPANDGVYTVTATDLATGCSATTSATISVLSKPVVTITPDGATTFCQGGSVELNANGAEIYVWSNASVYTAITVSASGSYTVTGTGSNGCTATSAATLVTVNPLPVVAITPDGPTTFCEGNSVVLTASGAGSYVWSNASTNAAITVNASGSYTVTGTDGNGCSQTSSVTDVVVNPLPLAAIAADGPTTFCQGGSVMLTASNGASYLWSDNTTGAAVNVSNSGTYSVVVTDMNGCSATSAVTTVTTNPVPTVSVTGVSTFCTENTIYLGYGPQSLSLSATAAGGTPGYTYSWMPSGATTSTVTVSPTSTTVYTVTVRDANDCTGSTILPVVVRDIRCGSKLDKVRICHEGSVPICVSPSAVPAHMSNHGDCLGDCSIQMGRIAGGKKEGMNLEEGNIQVYPNPAHNTINVALKETGSAYSSYQITDISGRVVISQQISGDVHADVISVDISHLVPGMYIIRAITDEGSNLSRFTVK